MKYAVIFICQGGDLEAKATLLAASLREHLRWDHELIAAIPVPESRWRQPRPATLDVLHRLGVRTATIQNRIAEDFPIGNKVSCLSVKTSADVKIYVDADVLCLRPCEDDTVFDNPFCAKPADAYTFRASDETWRHIYAAEGLSMPEETVLATVSGERMPPYFNSGFVAVRDPTDFGEAWGAVCRRIDSDPKVTRKRPWLEQIALPVTVHKLGLRWRCLPEEYNSPCHKKEIPPDNSIRFAHYHSPGTISRAPALRRCVEMLLGRYPGLEAVLAGEPQFRELLDPGSQARARC